MDLEKRNIDEESVSDILMPLPLTEEEAADFTEEYYNTEPTEGRFFRPGNGIFPNPNITIIPIIPGISGIPNQRGFSYIRYLNGNGDVGPVDIYINGRLVASSLNYREFTEYMRVFPGFYRVVVYKSGMKRFPVSVSTFNILPRRIYTAALTGDSDFASWELIVDSKRSLNPNKSMVRFIQLSPNAPLMDVYIDDRLVITDLDYREVSRYLTLNAGSHNLKLKVSVSKRTLLEDPGLNVRAGKSYGVYIVGNMDTRPGLQVLIALEGSSYLNL